MYTVLTDSVERTRELLRNLGIDLDSDGNDRSQMGYSDYGEEEEEEEEEGEDVGQMKERGSGRKNEVEKGSNTSKVGDVDVDMKNQIRSARTARITEGASDSSVNHVSLHTSLPLPLSMAITGQSLVAPGQTGRLLTPTLSSSLSGRRSGNRSLGLLTDRVRINSVPMNAAHSSSSSLSSSSSCSIVYDQTEKSMLPQESLSVDGTRTFRSNINSKLTSRTGTSSIEKRSRNSDVIDKNKNIVIEVNKSVGKTKKTNKSIVRNKEGEKYEATISEISISSNRANTLGQAVKKITKSESEIQKVTVNRESDLIDNDGALKIDYKDLAGISQTTRGAKQYDEDHDYNYHNNNNNNNNAAVADNDEENADNDDYYYSNNNNNGNASQFQLMKTDEVDCRDEDLSSGPSSMFFDIAVPASPPQLPPYDSRNPDPKSNNYISQIQAVVDEVEIERELRSMFNNDFSKDRGTRTAIPHTANTQSSSLNRNINQNQDRKEIKSGNISKRKNSTAEGSGRMLSIGLPSLNFSVNFPIENTRSHTARLSPASSLPSSPFSPSREANLSSLLIVQTPLLSTVERNQHPTQISSKKQKQKQHHQQRQRQEELNGTNTLKMSNGRLMSRITHSNSLPYRYGKESDSHNNFESFSNGSGNSIYSGITDPFGALDYKSLDRIAEQSLRERTLWDNAAVAVKNK